MMSSFEGVWTEKDFYMQPVNIWLKFIDPDEWNFHLTPLDLFTASTLSNDCYEVIENLIVKQNSELNKRNGGHWTPLMYAAYYGYEDLVNIFLKNGASLHPCNKIGKNALMIAARCGIESVVDGLIKYGTILEARDHKDFTAIFHAVYSGNCKVLQTLLKYGANPNACIRQSGKTPLMCAAILGDMEMTQLLLKSGSITTFTSVADNGKTAAMLAKDANSPHIADLINQWTFQASSGPSLRDGPETFEYLLAPSPSQHLTVQSTLNSYSINQACGRVVSDLDSLLSQLGLEAYISVLKEQEVDLQIFLSMTEQDLKDCGVNKIGPRRKMIAAIARWHGNAPLRYGLEAAYANKVEVELQQLNEKLTNMDSLARKLKLRLDEGNKRCRMMREHLNSAVYISYHCAAPPQFTESLKMLSTHLDDLLHITGFNISAGTSVSSP